MRSITKRRFDSEGWQIGQGRQQTHKRRRSLELWHPQVQGWLERGGWQVVVVMGLVALVAIVISAIGRLVLDTQNGHGWLH